MHTSQTKSPPGTDDQPARITFRNDVDDSLVKHYFISDDGQRLLAYVMRRDTGIDLEIPLTAIQEIRRLSDREYQSQLDDELDGYTDHRSNHVDVGVLEG